MSEPDVLYLFLCLLYILFVFSQVSNVCGLKKNLTSTEYLKAGALGEGNVGGHRETPWSCHPYTPISVKPNLPLAS